MGGDGRRVARGVRRATGDQNDVGEAGSDGPSRGIGAGGEQAEKIDLGFEFVDLSLELLLRLAGLLVALAARAGVAIAVILLARQALHPQPPPRRRGGRSVVVVVFVLFFFFVLVEVDVGIGGEPPPAMLAPPHSFLINKFPTVE